MPKKQVLILKTSILMTDRIKDIVLDLILYIN